MGFSGTPEPSYRALQRISGGGSSGPKAWPQGQAACQRDHQNTSDSSKIGSKSREWDHPDILQSSPEGPQRWLQWPHRQAPGPEIPPEGPSKHIKFIKDDPKLKDLFYLDIMPFIQTPANTQTHAIHTDP